MGYIAAGYTPADPSCNYSALTRFQDYDGINEYHIRWPKYKDQNWVLVFFRDSQYEMVLESYSLNGLVSHPDFPKYATDVIIDIDIRDTE